MLQLREKPGDVSTLDMYACKRTLDMYAMQAHARGRLTAPDCSAGFRRLPSKKEDQKEETYLALGGVALHVVELQIY